MALKTEQLLFKVPPKSYFVLRDAINQDKNVGVFFGASYVTVECAKCAAAVVRCCALLCAALLVFICASRTACGVSDSRQTMSPTEQSLSFANSFPIVTASRLKGGEEVSGNWMMMII